jgi:carboxymethylenebutenolidase
MPPHVSTSTSSGSYVRFDTPNSGADARAFQILSPAEGRPWLFVLHEFWGLNAHIEGEAHHWHSELNVNVLALDLYDGAVATNRDEGVALLAKATPDRLYAIMNGALDYIGRETAVSMLGWCFGGAWALKGAITGGQQVRSTAIYYGMPIFDPDELRKLHGPVLAIFGTEDKHISPEVKERFEQAMHEAGRELTTHSFKAGHAFATPTNPSYDPEATAKADSLTADFFRGTLLAR